MTLVSRILWIFGVVCVSMFVLATGRTNLHNYQRIQASIEEIYEDRLVVKGLIFELASSLHQKEIAQLTGDAVFYQEINATVDARIEDNLELFRATNLTPAESTALARLSSHIEGLQAIEGEYLLSEGRSLEPAEAQALRDSMDTLRSDLRVLSEIQLAEGKRRLAIATMAEADMTWIAWVEGALMVGFAILLIILCFLPGVSRPRISQRSQSGSLS